MSNNNLDILEILRSELKFLDQGGYERSKGSWRAPYIFEDSPICLNFKDRARSHPCCECQLMQFVPAEFHGNDVPCRFIPLNDEGVTVDSLYRTGTEKEMHDALRFWLCREINRIETDRKRARSLAR